MTDETSSKMRDALTEDRTYRILNVTDTSLGLEQAGAITGLFDALNPGEQTWITGRQFLRNNLLLFYQLVGVVVGIILAYGITAVFRPPLLGGNSDGDLLRCRVRNHWRPNYQPAG
jgi:hypothetical protein